MVFTGTVFLNGYWQIEEIKLITLTYANNGFDGIVEVGKSKPDLIILDFSMIGLNGFETATIIKRNENYKDIPIIFISSNKTIIDEVHGLMLGGYEYLPKNSNISNTMNIIKEYLKLDIR